ncbi:murein biosynthesis integral membrane protein MurJ [Solihabitans fulvus]|uniref:Murein biosynthesis integral membrane protein MurJ n=2 Tax=Solihabitans fulvus TaxID=1892852 RepID=A0A5B2WGV2_9PSEU|nr:murein biosynthesis integral membrane protein MurJ [Solihabitans fulvus]
MAIATIVSRVSGLASKALLTVALGFATVNDSYQVATTLPTMINELLLGGVLTSIVVPMLVRAEKEDADGGESYTQWMLTMSTVLLAVGTVVAIACAPLLTHLFLGGDTKANPALTTAFAYLVLPGIIFYGLTGLLSAILNTKHVFGLPTWAPVLNNVVVIITLGVYMLLPGTISIDPVRMGEPKLLILGVGTALGVAVQAVVMIPAIKRTGFRFRWRWGWDSRLSEFGSLAFWVLLYVGLGLASMVVLLNVAGHGTNGTITIYNYAWLLLQLPYGVLGYSLLTALMPKMSRAAASGDTEGLVADLSLGNRMSSVLLMPLAGLMTLAGPAIAIAAFSFGHATVEDAERLGVALSLAAFGLVPYAITLLQLRVFYALKDSRTPAIIQGIMVVARIALCYFFLAIARPDQLAVGVMLAMSLSFVVGSIVGQIWLRVRLGRLRTFYTIWTVCLTIVATVVACVVAKFVGDGAVSLLGAAGARPQAWIRLIVESVLVLVLSFGAMAMFRLPELRPATDKILRLIRRG